MSTSPVRATSPLFRNDFLVFRQRSLSSRTVRCDRHPIEDFYHHCIARLNGILHQIVPGLVDACDIREKSETLDGSIGNDEATVARVGMFQNTWCGKVPTSRQLAPEPSRQ